MKKQFFIMVCASLFLGILYSPVQGGSQAMVPLMADMKSESFDNIKTHPDPTIMTPRSLVLQLNFDIWKYDDKITFEVDRCIGELEIQILDAAGRLVKTATYSVAEGTVYSMDILALSPGDYTLLLIVPEYSGMRYKGSFKMENTL